MKIPEMVNIGGLEYSVTRVQVTNVGVDKEGQINYREQTIAIVDAGTEYAKISFLHELVHGMLEATGRIDHDELIVDGLAHQLYRLINDNPGMFTP